MTESPVVVTRGQDEVLTLGVQFISWKTYQRPECPLDSFSETVPLSEGCPHDRLRRYNVR